MKKYLIVISTLLIVGVVISNLMEKRNINHFTFKPKRETYQIGKEMVEEESHREKKSASQVPVYVGSKKSFEDILLEYGKEWGPVKDKVGFAERQNQEILYLVIDYASCEAISKNDLTKCNLPINNSDVKNECRRRFYIYKFLEFIQTAKDINLCFGFLKEIESNPKLYNDSEDIKVILNLNKKVPDLCNIVAAYDLDEVCQILEKKGLELKDCPFSYKNLCLRNKDKCKNVINLTRKEKKVECEFFNLIDEKESFEYCKGNCSAKLALLTSRYVEYLSSAKVEDMKLKKMKEEEEKIRLEKERLEKIKEEERKKIEEEKKKLEEEIIKKAKQAAEETKKFINRRKNEEE